MASYKLSYDQDIANDLKKRLASEITALENEGFSPFSLHQEIIYPFSALIFFPVYLAMLAGKEIIQIQSPFRITSFHLIYTSQTYASYAFVYGLGCKFYTNFTDGTWLISNTHLKIKNEAVIILKDDPEFALTDQIWTRHKGKIAELEAKGKLLNPHISFDTWVKLDQQFERDNLLSIIRIGFIWLFLVAGILYWLGSKLLTIIGAG